MKELSQLIVISVIAIILLPAIITTTLGNHKLADMYRPTTQKEQEYREEKQKLEQQLIEIIAKAMPITAQEESLKAQVIMARSQLALIGKDPANGEEIPQMSTNEMKELWGSDYKKNYSKIKKAVEDTQGITLTYLGEPIQLVYHLQSAGQTQSSLDIWDIDVPYLQSVESIADEKAPDLITKKEYRAQEVIKKINQHYRESILEPYSLETQIQIIERTQGGYVKSIQVGKQLMRGDDFRKLLNLRSSYFLCQYSGDYMSVTTKGVGHGVGLSQYGANEMAKQGKDYEAILSHYFPGTTLIQEN